MSNAKFMLTMSSYRLVLSPRDYSSISPSFHPSSFGTRSGPGCEPFVPASRHQSLSLQMRCARHFHNFSWRPPKTILSRNSSPIARTTRICGYSAWPHEHKEALLSTKVEHLKVKKTANNAARRLLFNARHF